MKKRIVMTLLAAVMGISLVACGDVSAPAKNETETAVEEEHGEDGCEDEEEAEEADGDSKDKEEAKEKDEDKASSEEAEVPHVEENIDIADTGLANDSMIAGWDVTKQPENDVDNRTNVSLSNMKKIGLKALPDDSMGMVYLSPNKSGTGRDMIFGTRELVMYFQRKDVKPGDGTISVFNCDGDTPICSVNAKQSVKAYDTSDGTFELLGWETGTRVVITLPFPLDHDERFYITADAGCFKAEGDDGVIESKAIVKDAWTIDVAEYGFIPQLPSGSNVYVGGSMDIAFYIHNRCKKAEITSFDENRIRFSKTEIREDKTIEVKFYQIGEAECMITFYDTDDNILGQSKLIFKADMDPNGELDADEDKAEEKNDDSNNTLNL